MSQFRWFSQKFILTVHTFHIQPILTRGNRPITLPCLLVIDDKHQQKHHYIKVSRLRARGTHAHNSGLIKFCNIIKPSLASPGQLYMALPRLWQQQFAAAGPFLSGPSPLIPLRMGTDSAAQYLPHTASLFSPVSVWLKSCPNRLVRI